MSDKLKSIYEKARTKKYKFSDKDERFNCLAKNHRRSEEACERRYSKEIRIKFNLKCKSKEQKNRNYLKHCKEVEEKYKIEKKKNFQIAFQERMLNLKRCEVCLDPVNNEYLLFCNICEDGYHCYCINPPILDLKEFEDYTCDNCVNLQENQEKDKYRQPTMDESFRLTIRKNQKKCFTCKEYINEKNNYLTPSISSRINKSKNSNKQLIKIPSNISGNESDEKLNPCYNTCTRCKKDFHNNCFFKIYETRDKISSKIINNTNKKNSSKNLDFMTQNNKNICGSCNESIKNISASMKISDFFKYEKNTSNNNAKKYSKNNICQSSENGNFRNCASNDIIMFDFSKNKNENVAYYPKFILWKPLMPEKVQVLKENLKNALIFKNIDFSDDLVFLDSDCPKEMNNSKLEPGIQKMSSYNKTIYYQFKQRTRQGEYPGLEIIEDPIQGHIVRAVEDIKKNTLICEYTGEVCLLRKKLFDFSNDSIMELIRHPSSSSSLVICPEKKGNIARFLSGINNNDKKAKKKQNVNSSRYDIDGKVHVLLYALKSIKKGEILYYDYNAGGSELYPTENFV